jgi:hypothetical protein
MILYLRKTKGSFYDCKETVQPFSRTDTGRAAPAEAVRDHAKETAEVLGRIANITRAKQVLRSPDLLLDRDLYGPARNAVGNAFRVLSAAWHPFHIRFNDVSYGRRSTLDGVLDIAANERVNPFIKVLRDHVLPQALPQVPPVVGISAAYHWPTAPARWSPWPPGVPPAVVRPRGARRAGRETKGSAPPHLSWRALTCTMRASCIFREWRAPGVLRRLQGLPSGFGP